MKDSIVDEKHACAEEVGLKHAKLRSLHRIFISPQPSALAIVCTVVKILKSGKVIDFCMFVCMQRL